MDDSRLLIDLRQRVAAGERPEYLFFWGHRPSPKGITASCFSQWFEAPFEIEGQRYPTAEHFMMAEKAALFGDTATREKILAAPSPGAAKALGREVSEFDDATWLAHRFRIVVRANAAKFAQNREMERFLHQTGSCVLVEASPVDRVWGIGLAKDDERIHEPNLWQGLNLLGFALMHVRDRSIGWTSTKEDVSA